MSCRTVAAVVAVAVSGFLATGCDSDRSRPTSTPVPVAWHEVTIPTPPGPPGRIAVRDATSCDGTWYVVGAVIGTDGESRPAAWTSQDARTWRSVAVEAREYYAQRAILRSVACHEERMAAVGSRSGGAHGNPRTASWYQRLDGTLVDVRADWTLFGGADAVSVNRIAAGPDGWLIGGTRRSGAAVWVSADATDFRLVDDDPALSSDATHHTVSLDQVHDGVAWTVVGRAEVPGRVGPVPLAWTSTDGTTWTREPVPAATDGFADLERVAQDGNGLLAVGIRDDRFGTWRRAAKQWEATESFGSLAADTTGARFVSGLAIAAGNALATVADGADFRLWAEARDHHWRPVRTPTRPANNGDDQLTVAASGSTVLLLADDGTSGRSWVADWNTLGQ